MTKFKAGLQMNFSYIINESCEKWLTTNSHSPSKHFQMSRGTKSENVMDNGLQLVKMNVKLLCPHLYVIIMIMIILIKPRALTHSCLHTKQINWLHRSKHVIQNRYWAHAAKEKRNVCKCHALFRCPWYKPIHVEPYGLQTVNKCKRGASRLRRFYMLECE